MFRCDCYPNHEICKNKNTCEFWIPLNQKLKQLNQQISYELNILESLNQRKRDYFKVLSEIQQELHGFDDVKVSFTPHLVPVIRGIQTTSHSFLIKDITPDELREVYEKEYKDEYFIKLMDEGEIPHLSSVRGSNFVHIGGFEIDETGRIVMLSVIDNLVKGASGQAIQNMNILLGLDESTGLKHFGLHP